MKRLFVIVLGFLSLLPAQGQLNQALLGAAHRRNAPPPSGWVPTDEGTNLKGWYDASLITGTSGDLKSSFTDSSGNGNTLTAAGSERPTLQTAVVNGLNILRFDGTANVIKNTAFNYSGATTWTVIAVYSKPSAGGALTNQRILSAYSGSGFDFTTGLIVSEGTNATYSPKGVINVQTSRETTQLALGAVMPAPNNYFGGDICEIIIVRGTISNTTGAKAYVLAKWGVTIP